MTRYIAPAGQVRDSGAEAEIVYPKVQLWRELTTLMRRAQLRPAEQEADANIRQFLEKAVK